MRRSIAIPAHDLAYTLAACAALVLLAGCPADAPAGGGDAAPAAPEVAETGTAAGEGGCEAFVEALKATARDAMDRGLAVRLNQPLATLEAARQQAGGNLFDVRDTGDGAANRRVANQVCDRQHQRLVERRQEAEANVGDIADLGPNCTEARGLADGCLDRLDTESLPEVCTRAIDTLRSARQGRENIELGCGMVVNDLRQL